MNDDPNHEGDPAVYDAYRAFAVRLATALASPGAEDLAARIGPGDLDRLAELIALRIDTSDQMIAACVAERLTDARIAYEHVTAERDRLALTLRCERGEWAPEGWLYSFSQGRWEHTAEPFARAWRNGWMRRADGSSYIAWGWEAWPGGEHVEGAAPTALEAIEACDAAIREVRGE